MANLNRDEFRDRVLGCWTGKNIGGTLGAPFEGIREMPELDFYTFKCLQGVWGWGVVRRCDGEAEGHRRQRLCFCGVVRLCRRSNGSGFW